MAKQCGECRYLDTSNKKDGQCFCKEKNEYRFANSYAADECSRFFRLGWGYTSDGKKAIEEADKYQKESHGNTCFITTIVVNILGLDDKCEALTVLRKFRKNVLQVDLKYRDILFQYDLIGPKIADALRHDNNAFDVACDVYFGYILKSVDALHLGDIETAISIYTEMVNTLSERYGISLSCPLTDKEKSFYNQREGGHGRLKLN